MAAPTIREYSIALLDLIIATDYTQQSIGTVLINTDTDGLPTSLTKAPDYLTANGFTPPPLDAAVWDHDSVEQAGSVIVNRYAIGQPFQNYWPGNTPRNVLPGGLGTYNGTGLGDTWIAYLTKFFTAEYADASAAKAAIPGTDLT